ncbi:MAG: YfjI family protein [Candidatus Paceibacterota bacterium]
MSSTTCTDGKPVEKTAGKDKVTIGKVKLHGKEYSARFDGRQWFYSRDPETVGWTAASPGMAKMLEDAIGQPEPQARSGEPEAKAMPRAGAKSAPEPKTEPPTAEKPNQPKNGEAEPKTGGGRQLNGDWTKPDPRNALVQCGSVCETEKVAVPLQHASIGQVGPLAPPAQPPEGSSSVNGAHMEEAVLASAGTASDERDADSPAPSPELIPLANEAVPAFPLDALPPVLRDWAATTAEATQTPADMSGLLSLAVCAASVAKRVEVEPRPGWFEPVNLFVAVVLGPANRKSAVFRAATKPLAEFEAEIRKQQGPDLARQISERRQAEKRLANLETFAAQPGDEAKAAKAQTEAGDLAEELQAWPEPSLPRLITDDCTSEKLAVLLNAHGERMACMSAEGGIFDLMAGKYTGGACDLNVYLMAHAGDTLRVERIGRESVVVDRPALTMGLAIQPSVIRGLADKPAFRGRGLLARFLYAVPESPVGRRRIDPPSVPASVQLAYANVVHALASIPPSHDHQPRKLVLAADAQKGFSRWRASIEPRLAEGGDLEALSDWGGKLDGLTMRLAGVMHCVACGGSKPWNVPISEETLDAAIRISEYAIPHAEAAMRLLKASPSTANDDAEYLLRWIRNEELSRFSRRDAQGHGRRRFDGDPKRLEEALQELERTNHVRRGPRPSRGKGRPPSNIFRVNPRVFDALFGSDTHTHDNVSDQDPASTSVDIAHTNESDEPAHEVFML